MNREIMNTVNLCFDAVNAIILLTIMILVVKKLENSASRKGFLFLLTTILIFDITDCSTWAFEGADAVWKIPALRITTFIFYLDAPFMYISFLKFTRGIMKESSINNKFYVVCLIPCVLDLIGSFLSCYPGVYYSISADNIYSRTPYYYLHVAFIFGFYVLAVMYIASNRKQMDRKTFLTILSFPTLPTLCYIPQLLFYGVATVNIGLVVSMILIYTNLKKSMQEDVQRTVVFSSEYFQKHNKVTFAEKIRRFLCNYGFSDNAIESIRNELQDNVSYSLKIITSASGLFTAVLFILSFFVTKFVGQRIIYLGTTLLCLLLAANFHTSRNHKTLAVVSGYLFFLMMFGANIFKCLVITPDEVPILFVFVLCIAPPVFCNKPYIITLLEYAVVFIYMDLAKIYKLPENAASDSLYLFGLTTFALIIGYGMSKTKITSIYLTKNLDNEVAAKTKQLNAISKEIVTTLTSSIESKDEYTNGHSERVANYSVMIANKLGWNEAKCDELWMEAVLHDVGKIGIPDNILKKTERLTDEEFKVIQTHTVKGAKILENLASFPNAKDAAHYHHEKINGKGYPVGLMADAIPDAAKIVSIADAYDAMTSSRCYRPALPNEVVMNELRKGRGTQFDEKMLDVFLDLLSEHGGSLVEDKEAVGS